MSIAGTRHRTYEVLDPQQEGRFGRVVDLTIMALIVLSVVAIILETVDALEAQYGAYFSYFEVVTIVVFTVEYLARLWSITSSEAYRDPVTGRFRYAMTPYMLIDLLAILPFYLGGVVDLRFIRMLRLLRIFRVLKVARYSNALQTIGAVFRKKRPDIVVTIVVTSMLLVLTSSAMYYVEHQAQPDVFTSIPATFWWAVITLTTVGYGDVYPVTPLGQLLAGVSAFLGIGMFALPASILASGFIEEATESDDPEWEYCPHCGEKL